MAKSVPDCTTLFIPTALKSFNIVWLVNLCLYHVTLNVYCWFVPIKTNIFKSKHIFKTTWRKLTEISPTHNPETIAREISGRNAWKNGKRKFTNCFWKKKWKIPRKNPESFPEEAHERILEGNPEEFPCGFPVQKKTKKTQNHCQKNFRGKSLAAFKKKKTERI